MLSNLRWIFVDFFALAEDLLETFESCDPLFRVFFPAENSGWPVKLCGDKTTSGGVGGVELNVSNAVVDEEMFACFDAIAPSGKLDISSCSDFIYKIDGFFIGVHVCPASFSFTNSE